MKTACGHSLATCHTTLCFRRTFTAGELLRASPDEDCKKIVRSVIQVATGNAAIVELMRGLGPLEIISEEENPMLAPGQAEDNYVHKLSCGHEHDDCEQLPPGFLVRCSMHGIERVL